MTDAIKVFKGFNPDWTCRGFQFKVGETFEHAGDVSVCNSGFHACEYPLDIFNYYPPTGQIAECELSGLDRKTDNDSKRAGRSITIKASLTIPLLVSATIEYVATRCEPTKAAHSDEDQSASSATGDRSASSATGDRSASSATGKFAVAAAFGLESKAKAGKTGIVIVAWMDGKRKRVTTGYVGEDGIEEDVWYRANAQGVLVKETP